MIKKEVRIDLTFFYLATNIKIISYKNINRLKSGHALSTEEPKFSFVSFSTWPFFRTPQIFSVRWKIRSTLAHDKFWAHFLFWNIFKKLEIVMAEIGPTLSSEKKNLVSEKISWWGKYSNITNDIVFCSGGTSFDFRLEKCVKVLCV